MDVFLFGALVHTPLLAVVSGDADVAQRLTWAVRPGYSVNRVPGQVFPVMQADPNGVAEGMIAASLSEDAIARLDYYQRAFGHERTEFAVLDADHCTRTVNAYLAKDMPLTAGEPWDREGWRARHGAITTDAAHEAMRLMETIDATAMGRTYAGIEARAASRARAATSPANGGMGRADVEIVQARNRYAGFFNVEELDLRHRRFDGSMSKPVNRAVAVGVDCAIVLPYDPVRDCVLLIEQFRPGAYLRGDPNPWTVEPIAGRIDEGETPEEAAIREAHEEAGITLRDLHCVSAAYPSPGLTTEHFYVYVGLCDLPDGIAGLGGVASEAEDIRSEVLAWTDFDTALNAGTFRLLPLVVAGHWLARNRDRLRASP